MKKYIDYDIAYKVKIIERGRVDGVRKSIEGKLWTKNIRLDLENGYFGE